jgi:hypothetical protein
MCQRILGVWAIVLGLGWGEAQAGPMFNISYSDGSSTLTGFIETAVASGPIGLADIVSWAFSSTGPVTFAISSAANGTTAVCDLISCFSVVASELDFDFSSRIPDDPFAQFTSTSGSSGITFSDSIDAPDFGAVEWHAVVSDKFVSASVVPGSSAVGFVALNGAAPEPSSISLIALVLTGLGFARKHSRGQRSNPI